MESWRFDWLSVGIASGGACLMLLASIGIVVLYVIIRSAIKSGKKMGEGQEQDGR